MFKIKFFYKVCVLLGLFLLSACNDDYFTCQRICSTDKQLFFTFEKTDALADLDPEKLSIVLKSLNTGSQRSIKCRPNSHLLPSFTTRQIESETPFDRCVITREHSFEKSSFSVRLFDVKEEKYLFIIDYDAKAINEFEYIVKYDYRLCTHYCKNISFELGDDLKPI